METLFADSTVFVPFEHQITGLPLFLSFFLIFVLCCYHLIRLLIALYLTEIQAFEPG
jgi:hypothetical protein